MMLIPKGVADLSCAIPAATCPRDVILSLMFRRRSTSIALVTSIMLIRTAGLP